MKVLAMTSYATSWKLRTREIVFHETPCLMGIVNVTPDSFSDGGKYFDAAAAIDHGLELADEGAGILDIGGESTRPYSTPVTEEEELRRVTTVVHGLKNQIDVPISIDTTKAAVARAAIEAGAEIINDVSGLERDPDMLPLAIESGAGVCVMHSQGTPQTMQDDPRYENVVQEVYDYLQDRRQTLITAGVHVSRICLDPGIGFGKTHAHNLELMVNCHRFHNIGSPLLVGHSRKGFIAHVLGDKHADRTAGTIGSAISLTLQGVQVIRIHDVAAIRQAILLFRATHRQ